MRERGRGEGNTPARSAFRILFAACLLPVLLAGCSLLGGGSREPVTTYSPMVETRTDAAWPTVDWQLTIVPTTAPRVVDSPRISVRRTPSELQVYAGSVWAQPATELVELALLRTFEASGRIPAVATSGAGIRADYKLVLDLRRFEADYAGRDIPQATIELGARLLHNHDQRVVASRTFLQTVPAGNTAVESVVGAFEQALAQVSHDVAGWTLVSGDGDAGRPAMSAPRPQR
ncbi:ABC transporter [Luteimonas yindakuii]|uniref:ABC-type transport auxiliary lipoprotein family protein n=1 Tax=Luteimonas yindakuii TaxID=2565782 RepID=UPI0011079C71|nr:ABC-type transport auxiliary lipoprotein family protein [Luteimonas yindakuii]QCO66925.2 ABC transporter [Luteimonas yindakuii]